MLCNVSSIIFHSYQLVFYLSLCLYTCFYFTLTVEMARQKSALRAHSKSVTVEGASTAHVDDETNQEMHKASTQGQFVFYFCWVLIVYICICVFTVCIVCEILIVSFPSNFTYKKYLDRYLSIASFC